jgi:hypothetical protein
VSLQLVQVFGNEAPSSSIENWKEDSRLSGPNATFNFGIESVSERGCGVWNGNVIPDIDETVLPTWKRPGAATGQDMKIG